jgi:hypothetical protein
MCSASVSIALNKKKKLVVSFFTFIHFKLILTEVGSELDENWVGQGKTRFFYGELAIQIECSK